MKKKIKSFIGFALVALAVCFGSITAEAQVTNQAGTIGYDLGSWGVIPGTPTTITNLVTNTITGSTIINLGGRTNLTIFANGKSSTNSASVSSGVVTYVFAGSIDGTNFTVRTSTLTLPFTVTGTTNNTVVSNYAVGSYQYWKLATVENNDGTNWIAAPVLQYMTTLPK